MYTRRQVKHLNVVVIIKKLNMKKPTEIFKQNKFTIQDIKDGKVAIHNDGTVSDIRKVVFMVSGTEILGLTKYYYIELVKHTLWQCTNNKPNLPIQSAKDFL